MAESEKQTMGFQAEVKQLLQLMIHSLYSNKEIFLRELISNASDAIDRLRYEALDKPELQEHDPDLKIRISFSPENRTITISDNGIGMSRDEAIAHLGTIANRDERISGAPVERPEEKRRSDRTIRRRFLFRLYRRG